MSGLGLIFYTEESPRLSFGFYHEIIHRCLQEKNEFSDTSNISILGYNGRLVKIVVSQGRALFQGLRFSE